MKDQLALSPLPSFEKIEEISLLIKLTQLKINGPLQDNEMNQIQFQQDNLGKRPTSCRAKTGSPKYAALSYSISLNLATKADNCSTRVNCFYAKHA